MVNSDNLFHPFLVAGLFLYPLKTEENLKFSDVFRGYRKRPVARNWLTKDFLPYLAELETEIWSSHLMIVTFYCRNKEVNRSEMGRLKSLFTKMQFSIAIK